jgi:hypothetical protein
VKLASCLVAGIFFGYGMGYGVGELSMQGDLSNVCCLWLWLALMTHSAYFAMGELDGEAFGSWYPWFF